MSENPAVYEKTSVAVVNDVPAHLVKKVLEGLQAEFQTYETAGGKEGEVKTHQTSFAVAGKGDYARIEHIGRLKRPLKDAMGAFAAGMVYLAEHPISD